MSTVYERPGVFVEERLLQVQPTASPVSPPAAFMQTSHRGPTDFTRVTSWSAYTKLFGRLRPNDLLGYSLHSFFNNGGSVAYVARIIGTGAAAATRELNDRAGVPAPTLRVDAHNPGAWGNDLYVTITDGSASNLFSLIVHYKGATSSDIVERWADVSMDESSQRYVESVVNSSSPYIRVTNLRPGVELDDTARPAVQEGTTLAGGADGDAVTVGDRTDALDRLDAVEEPVVLSLAGDTSIASEAVAYADARKDIFVVLDPPKGATVADLTTFAGGVNPASSFGAIYAPYLKIPDPTTSARGATVLIPPSGAVVGQYARTDLKRGVFKTPAGTQNRLAGVAGLERRFTHEDLEALNRNHINALVTRSNTGSMIYGGRTLRRTLEADRYVNVRRTLIHLRRTLAETFAFAVFENNDANLWAQITNAGTSYLSTFWQAGGLRGARAEEAFYVKCDAETNPDEQVVQGYLNVEVGVALQHPAEFIVIRLSQFQGETSSTITI